MRERVRDRRVPNLARVIVCLYCHNIYLFIYLFQTNHILTEVKKMEWKVQIGTFTRFHFVSPTGDPMIPSFV